MRSLAPKPVKVDLDGIEKRDRCDAPAGERVHRRYAAG